MADSVNPLLVAALDYARRGWRVIPLHNLVEGGLCSCDQWRAEKHLEPCRTPGKHPRYRKYAELATTAERRIAAWWRSDPLANVGVISGKGSRLVVLDTDPRNGGDWARHGLEEKYGKLPESPICVTGGKGTHEHYLWPADFDTDQSVIEIAEGVELLLEGHNVVMPPSFAHAGGDAYFWDVEPEGEIPPAPDWLIALARQKLEPRSAPKQGQANKWPPADIGQILQRCEWMRYTSEHAASLSEPEWYAQLSILGRCENGAQLAQDLSSPHPGYNSRATAEKLRHAIEDAGPATCAKIRHRLGGEKFCRSCQERVKSPVVLGISRAPRLDDVPPPGDGDVPPEYSAPEHFVSPSAEEASAPEPGPKVVPGETFALMQAVDAAIAADSIEQALDLAPLLAKADALTLAKAMAKLRGHFKKRLSTREMTRAIAGEKKQRGPGSAGGGRGGGRRGGWELALLTASNGNPRGNLANAITALRRAPEWQGVLWRNEFAECTVARKKPPFDAPDATERWSNHHDTLTADWLQHHDIDVSVEIAGRAVEAVAYDRTFHPVRDYLRSLAWDGVPRIDTWLETYCGAQKVETVSLPLRAGQAAAKQGPNGYLASVGSKWLISAVARVMQPGCKADCALVLEGEQGKGKSTVLSVMGGKWFTDQIEVMGSKDASMQTHGVWVIEIAELASLSKAQVEDVKAFMSRPRERYRPPYAARLVEIPRQCVFGGTVNLDDYVRDETGARRFWPVSCSDAENIKIDKLREDRDQLWAEARVRYDEGATWWLDVDAVIETAKQEQASRYRQDPWDPKIWQYVRFMDEVTIDDVMTSCLELPANRQTQADANRVAAVLRVRGWKRIRKREKDQSRVTVYRPYSLDARLSAARQETLV